ncbi:MAG TPA: hypothetical protein VGI40_25900 [Pirellulaceae bacterium]|jgi:hypothetical protein
MLFAFAAVTQSVVGRFCSLIGLIWALVSSPLLLAAEPIDFTKRAAVEYRQAKLLVEVEGKLKLNGDSKEVKHVPLKATGELYYFERLLPAAKKGGPTRILRDYQSAHAKIRLHESDISNELRPERKLVGIQLDGDKSTFFSPNGPLTREELELVSVPGGGIVPDSLLPERAVKIGDKWPLSDATVARLLDLDSVSQHDVACSLDSVKDKENVAVISLAGKVAGAIDGVSSDIELKGKLNYDLKQRTVTWLTLAYKENRAIGHSQPGFEVLTTVRMVSAPAQPVVALGDKALADVPLEASPGQTLVEVESEAGGFHLTHDRRWTVILERPDVTVLRFVDQGDLISQCNISPLPALAKGEQLSMDGFQEEVKRVLGKNFEEMVEATEEVSESGLRILRVVVAGKAGELPIQWAYYHISDEAGHRASLVFTIESNLLERFASVDRELVANFEFIEGKQPTPAGTATESRASGN